MHDSNDTSAVCIISDERKIKEIRENLYIERDQVSVLNLHLIKTNY